MTLLEDYLFMSYQEKAIYELRKSYEEKMTVVGNLLIKLGIESNVQKEIKDISGPLQKVKKLQHRTTHRRFHGRDKRPRI